MAVPAEWAEVGAPGSQNRLDRRKGLVPGAGGQLSGGPATRRCLRAGSERTDIAFSAAGARSSSQHRCRTPDADGAAHFGRKPKASAASGERSGRTGSGNRPQLTTAGVEKGPLSGLSGQGGATPGVLAHIPLIQNFLVPFLMFPTRLEIENLWEIG